MFKPGRFSAAGGYVGMTLWPDGTAEMGEYVDLGVACGGWASAAGTWAADEGRVTVTLTRNAGNMAARAYPFTVNLVPGDADGRVLCRGTIHGARYDWAEAADDAKKPRPPGEVKDFDAAAYHRARAARAAAAGDRGSRGRGGRGGRGRRGGGGRGGESDAAGRGAAGDDEGA